jgi:hypothetical protein
LKGDLLAVHFVQFGQSRPSAIVQSIWKELREKLSARYGVENVKVVHEIIRPGKSPSCEERPNPRASLDAAMSFSLHIERHRRRASDAQS